MARITWLMLFLTAVLAWTGPILEGRERAAEQAVRAYVDATARGDADAALALIHPTTRDDWRIFVSHQAGDSIRLKSVAVQRQPLLSGPMAWASSQSVSLVGEIVGKGDERWTASSLVLVERSGDRLLLLTPPFGPDEPWLVPPSE